MNIWINLHFDIAIGHYYLPSSKGEKDSTCDTEECQTLAVIVIRPFSTSKSVLLKPA